MMKAQVDNFTFQTKIAIVQTQLAHTFQGINILVLIGISIVPYLQFLMFSFDDFPQYWFQQDTMTIFGYLDFGTYMATSSLYLPICIGLLYVVLVWALILIPGAVDRRPLLWLNKAYLLILPVLFVGIVGRLSTLINTDASQSMEIRIVGMVSLALFTVTFLLQSYINFDYVRMPAKLSLARPTNISVITFLLMVVINIIKDQVLAKTDEGTMIKLIILNVSFVTHAVILIIKRQILDDNVFKIQFSLLFLNLMAVLMTDLMVFLGVRVRFSLWVILSLLFFMVITHIQLFSMKYLLDNINKWNNSATVLAYTKQLRDLLYLRYDGITIKEYQNMLLYGYIEIHHQKCEQPRCPTKVPMNIPPGDWKTENHHRIDGMIKLIFTFGNRLSPVDPELLVEYAVALYQIGLKQRALKIMLTIKTVQLPFHSYCKYYRLKKQVHNQLLEEPNQSFLNILSQLHLKALEDQITKKFEQAALINLQFWSILNEDNPDFQKLTEIGRSRVKISDQVHELYKKICKLASSQRITDIYISYLTFIENGQEFYNEIMDDIHEEYHLKDKILIQNWANNPEPIMLISTDDLNYGDIIDINSTCALLFGYEKYELINRHFKCLFPMVGRQAQTTHFLPKKGPNDLTFFIEHKNQYLVKVKRKIKSFNSMDTGMAAFINITSECSTGSCFLLFNQKKIIGLSASSINMLNIQKSITEEKYTFEMLFCIKMNQLKKEKNQFKMENILESIGNTGTNDINKDDKFDVSIEQWEDFSCIDFSPLKPRKAVLLETGHINPDQIGFFGFDFHEQQGEFFFFGEADLECYQSHQQFFLSLHNQKTLHNHETNFNFSEGISTLRLHENYIKVIEQTEEELIEDRTDTENQTSQDFFMGKKIGKKDEDIIFGTRKSYKKFMSQNSTRNFLKPILFIGLLLTLTLYFINFLLFGDAKKEMNERFKDISIDNSIIGMIARVQSLTYRWELQAKGIASQSVQQSYHELKESIQEINEKKSQFSAINQLEVYINNNKQKEIFLTDEFLLSYENMADSFLSSFHDDQTIDQVLSSFQLIHPEVISYLRVNGNITKQQMVDNVIKRVERAQQKAGQYEIQNIIFLAVGFALEGILAAAMMCMVSRKNQEKIEILEAFLNVTQHQIHSFSAKTERFLIILHGQQANDELEEGDDEEQKKKQASMFLRKKRFKVIKFSQKVYIKILVVPILAIGFCLQFFFLNNQHITFMKQSMKYSYLQTKFVNIFYTGLSRIQQQILLDNGQKNTQLTNQLNNLYLSYYREYFSEHYETFGKIQRFHDFFTKVFIYDICDGDVKIMHACQLQYLTSNGSLLVFTHISVTMEQANFTKDLDNQFYIAVKILMHAHQKMYKLSLEVEEQLSDEISQNMLIIFVCWSSALIILGLLYGIRLVNSFSEEISVNKNMLVFFPVSIARHLPQIKRYIIQIMNDSTCC